MDLYNNAIKADTIYFKISNIDKFARYGLLLGFCLDLSGHLGIRTILSFTCLLYLFLRNIIKFKENYNFIILFLLLAVYPFFQFMRAYAFYTPNEFIGSQFMSTFQMIFLYISLKKESGATLLNEFVNSLFIVEIIVVILFSGGFLGNAYILTIIQKLGEPFNGGYFGFLLVDGFTVPQIYFKSTLFYIFPTVYFFYNKNYIKSIISLITLVISISKAGTFLALFGILILILNRRKITDFLFVIIFFALIYFFGESYFNNYLELKDSYTLYVRDLQIEWFKNWMISDPLSFFGGMGIGSNINIPGYGIANALELDHLDTLRKYGFLWFGVVFVILIRIIIKSFSKKGYFGIAIAFLMTLLGVGTNPLFLTSLFFILTYIMFKLNYE